jgi:crossover junction endodeoxyribonuclease RuvC
MKRMNVLAIDPGLEGAGAVIGADGELIEVFDLPVVGEGAGRRVDAANLTDLVRAHAPYRLAVIERVNAFPKQGVASTFRFGVSFGIVVGVVAALAIPARFVSPAQWKRTMRLNNRAETSRMRAIELFPGRCELFGKKKHHHRAEACLLGLYGMKQGGEP